jgi:hypothetical protein
MTRRRLGWDGGAGATLEQVGEEFGVTRERTRQIVASALRKPDAVDSTFLSKAIECVAASIPTDEGSAEQALVDAGITRSRISLRCLVRTAKHLEVMLPWRIEEWNGRRVVVDDAGAKLVDEFLQAARWRVSHFGVTTRTFVLSEGPSTLAMEKLELLFSLLADVKWLDEAHEWFWVPTARNTILSRVAKILRAAPRISIDLARTGVLRDGHMQEVTLPPDVFRALCQSLPWCHVEGDELIAGDAVPVGEDDSDEQAVVRILMQSGSVMNRRQLWAIAKEAGIGKVNFYGVLSNSPVIVRHAPDVYGLIASDAPIFG